MEILQVVLTALLSAAALFGTAKLMGHKQVAQLDFFDYISGITIGSIAAELATELEAQDFHNAKEIFLGICDENNTLALFENR